MLTNLFAMLRQGPLHFTEPRYLWLLAGPAVMGLLWARAAALRHRDAARLAQRREVPRAERFSVAGDALFWLALLLSTTLLVLALAQPRVVTSLVRTGGADVVVLLDGSASMQVSDVDGSRWQRSIRFLRVLGDALSWQDDRIALTLFAHIAAPQVRLTRDPTTYFFFLDNLADRSPFRLEDDSSWDTNIALGLTWGLRIVEKDEELRGQSQNATVFLLISDGQAWSGVVEDALSAARRRRIPVFVAGVGTERGGNIPDPKRTPGAPPIVSRLDRASLRTIATAGGGEYVELDRGSDLDVANRLIDSARRRAPTSRTEPLLRDVYWPFLAAAGAIFVLGCLFLRERVQCLIPLAAAAVTLAVLTAILR